jgi:hypothetical protein
MKQLFEAASQLPRSQQQKLAAVLEAFVNQHAPSVNVMRTNEVDTSIFSETKDGNSSQSTAGRD